MNTLISQLLGTIANFFAVINWDPTAGVGDGRCCDSKFIFEGLVNRKRI